MSSLRFSYQINMPSRGSESWWGSTGQGGSFLFPKVPLLALEATSNDEWYWVSPTLPTRTSTCREDLLCQADTINSLSDAGNGADMLRALQRPFFPCKPSYWLSRDVHSIAGALLPLQAFLSVTQRANYSAGLWKKLAAKYFFSQYKR